MPARTLHRTLAATAVAASTLAVAGLMTAASPARPSGARPAALTAFAAPAKAHQDHAKNWKKGVGAWAYNDVNAALKKSGSSWFYTWGVSREGIAAPHVSFVPMIWGASSVTTKNLRKVKKEGKILLTFNEPDLPAQANMSVSQALKLWPRLEHTGMRLGSPAVAGGAATPGSWLADFMAGARARHYRVNFITLHWYGGNFNTSQAVSELKGYIQSVWNAYHKPIWLTEFALWRFNPSVLPGAHVQARFVTAATKMLQSLPYVWRYAWFALPVTRKDGSAGLYHWHAKPTDAGRAFEKVDA
jgi:hypothetical protein